MNDPRQEAEPVEVIEVSPEMTVMLGRAAQLPAPPAEGAVVLLFGLGTASHVPTLRILAARDLAALALEDDPAGQVVALLLAGPALLRLGGRAPGEADARGYHLASELRAIAVALRDCPMGGEARRVYRAAKGIELLCETIRLMEAAGVVPLASGGGLSLADATRILAARRMIDERWSEPLSLQAIGRACGLNRAKLTRGFRDMFDVSIAKAIAERRLSQAGRMLLTTDLPVSSIGYENGYLNNASFARAFARRYGVAPSNYRAARLAA
jgi:AraC family transcriptional regulator, transcriptional activator of the genes for pyochelin and ferripyochelin receptors